ncbi:MAG: hypothetical protein JSU69_01240 [Candidatus Zixiibacteriota bacterium]|nr:MAG: hypothetical protein JSU69_01240 [candidate division Zixibacteria bacterium]
MNDIHIENGSASGKKILLAIILIAVVLRIVLALVSDNVNHPDEVFQVLEQSHRVVFGYGIVPWEYRLSARSWLVPGLMTLILYPLKVLGIDNPNIYVPLVKIILSLISLVAVYSAYVIGRRLASERAGLWAAFLFAIWFEIVYFSIRPLSEVWATTFLLAAVAIQLTRRSKLQIASAGLLACLCVAIRINYFPIVLVLVIMGLKRMTNEDRRVYLLSIFATLVGVGIVETMTLGKPFTSYINFLNVDKTFFMAGPLGSKISTDYLMCMGYASLFLYWLIPLLGLAFWRKTRVILAMLAVAVLTHILIPAKDHQIDYRHIYVAIPLIMIIGGIIIARTIDMSKNARMRNMMVIIFSAILLIISVSGSLARIPCQKNVYAGKTFEVYDHSIYYSNPILKAYRYLYNQDDVYAVYDASTAWFRAGGFYYLHRDVPLYYNITPPPTGEHISHIIIKGELYGVNGFELIKSIDDINVYHRSNKTFGYKRDPAYTTDIIQLGVDDVYSARR